MEYIEIKCANCNSVFPKNIKDYSRDSKRSQGNKFFCSRDCFNQHQTTSKEVECKHCGKKFKKALSQIKISKNHYCSISCASHNVGRHRREPVIFTDEKCHRVYELIEKYGITKVAKKIKSDRPTVIKNLKRVLGEDLVIPRLQKKLALKHGQRTKKEVFSNAKNWQSARSGIQKKSRENYHKSDKPKCCKICGYDKHIEVAHIKSVSDFDYHSTFEEMVDISNLVALCPNHHWEFDKGLIDKKDLL